MKRRWVDKALPRRSSTTLNETASCSSSAAAGTVRRLSSVVAVIAWASAPIDVNGRSPCHPSHKPPPAANTSATGMPIRHARKRRVPLFGRFLEGRADGDVIAESFHRPARTATRHAWPSAATSVRVTRVNPA